MADPNVEAARVVGRRAELGWFDVEFIMYGCAYLQNGKVYYRVSSQAEDIYLFTKKAAIENVFTSNVLKFTEKCSVPSGMRDLIANDVKKDLARQLKKMYPVEFFNILSDLAKRTESDVAATLLWEEAEQLEGIFIEEKINQYELLVQYAMYHHSINANTYQSIMKWICEERKNMDENVVSKDFCEKTIYGFAYEKDEKIKYIDNVLQSYILEKAEQLEQEGYLITPILSHTYWYEQTRRISEILNEFRSLLKDVYDSAYMEKIRMLRDIKVTSDIGTFHTLVNDTRLTYGNAAADTLTRYGNVWDVQRCNVIK